MPVEKRAPYVAEAERLREEFEEKHREWKEGVAASAADTAEATRNEMEAEEEEEEGGEDEGEELGEEEEAALKGWYKDEIGLLKRK
jgi:hypothetical protein